MRKIALVLGLLVISTYSFATANFTSGTGTFVVPNVSVDGKTHYESVTLKFDFGNRTFDILDATLKDTSFSPTALETVTANGMKLEFYGCARSGHNQISCLTKVTSTSADIRTQLNSDDKSRLFDNLGKEYQGSVSAFDQNSNVIDANLILGIPVEVKHVFDDIDIQATSISAFKPVYWNYDIRKYIEGNFRNINF